ncbi:SPRY domain-containing SOCS box protein 4 [Dipodomys spectabilis]|uniref:SPRY domain-containing SOCS box protein 4 n=1 Tax=Dipodomys spectabilis TaxID=105255 RepID=UPI001C54AAB1|nr:SPRY domain-containing SOCS box protein 4 [Dipodomys spectabilis]
MGQKLSGSLKAAEVRDPAGQRRCPSSSSPAKRAEAAAAARGPEAGRPARLDQLLDMPAAGPAVQLRHAWNPEDRSLNVFVKDDDRLTFHRHPVAQSTDGIRGKVGHARGLHAWQIHWPARQRGTHAVVGVATARAPLHAVGYTALVGSDAESWGWDLGRGRLYHDGDHRPGAAYPAGLAPGEAFATPDSLLVLLDMDAGTLSFVADGRYLGVAFRGLRGRKLYPVVSAVWGHCEVTMRYINGLDPEPLPLMDLCRRAIRSALGRHRLQDIGALPLPEALKNYLQYQ